MATTVSNSRQALAVLIVRDSLEDLNAALMRATEDVLRLASRKH
jgi:hypothetical protein